ncbi:L-fucose:H+ symporter permease [Aeoliella sp. ICT_H6.2]|uniref:L-fucose:H+ symporter permease n=1 Tax=Aeoliella straminimaris TaxID=2954799 RepID=A0A9X2FF89_9BACT|nr:L-fucose:H+ symporter permease [Aeoliella straminimaris]MCO6048005.1 L-fucose:H+ symporter permease [Aeoliella straminimaris]
MDSSIPTDGGQAGTPEARNPYQSAEAASETDSHHRVIPPGKVWAFFLLSSCFLWWAIANNLTDPLVKVFENIFTMSTFQSTAIQFAFYFGYFCMALPGALIARKYSYKTGVLVGLGCYALGCFLLYPAMIVEQFFMFCIAYYVLACGLGILETNANPYVMVLGSEESATRRLNFAQSFNPIGSVIGIMMCRNMIMANLPKDAERQISIGAGEKSAALSTVVYPYLVIAAILAVVWILILISKMPKASDRDGHVHFGETMSRLVRNGNYMFSVFAQFCYVGTQISVWTFTNYYIPEQLGVSQEEALVWHTGALVLFGCSRWIFTGLMKVFRPSSLLLFAAIMACVATLTVIFVGGEAGVIALVCISGFMSLMFPTIFGLGCANLGSDTKIAASGQIMAIVGGALITPTQGWMVDHWGVNYSYLLPLLCFVVIGIYSMVGRQYERSEQASELADIAG